MSKKVILLIFLPWFLSEMLGYFAELSYVIAWLGSLFVFYLTICSPFKFLNQDITAAQQVMRPITLIQLVFAGFMCCTSIFYFMDQLGYGYAGVGGQPAFQSEYQINNIAKCQRLALLAHCALVSGMIAFTKTYTRQKREITISFRTLTIALMVSTFAAREILLFVPGLGQFGQPLSNICVNCSVCLLLLGMKDRDKNSIIFGGVVFSMNILNALFSGFKEVIILHLLQFIFFAYPYYKKAVRLYSIPLICLLLYALPTFTVVFRNQSWSQKKSKEQAGIQAYKTLVEEDNEQEILDNSWEFLTNRFSEIGMFIMYIQQVPDHDPYYGTEILKNSFFAVIPRIIWPEKPNTEKLAMERVYLTGIVNRGSIVSAKTRPVVDAYLMAGPIGIFFTMLIYGALTQLICNMAEKLFGGYPLGCAIIFNGLFQCLWRGNTLEFLINNIIYSWMLMIVIYCILKAFHIVKPISNNENYTHYPIV